MAEKEPIAQGLHVVLQLRYPIKVSNSGLLQDMSLDLRCRQMKLSYLFQAGFCGGVMRGKPGYILTRRQ